MKNYINILDICEKGTSELGPGLRYVIWVQGCPFNCKGCTTPGGIPIVANNLVEIEQIIFSVLSNREITGITVSGGEPFLQASKISKIISGVKIERPELDVIVFTGFKLTELDWPEAKELLTLIDVLIDGKYVDRLNDNKGLRGSSNQKVHFLSGRLREHEYYFTQRRRSVEVHIYDHYQTLIGIPEQTIFKN